MLGTTSQEQQKFDNTFVEAADILVNYIIKYFSLYYNYFHFHKHV